MIPCWWWCSTGSSTRARPPGWRSSRCSRRARRSRWSRFDVDQLVDYRSRRPPLRFETDHWEHYAAPELDVVALTDTGGTGYLLLTGPEPDTQWERFAAALEELVRRSDIRLVVNLTGDPDGRAAHPARSG